MTASDIVAGGLYRGGKAGRIRVVDKITEVGLRFYVRWHMNSNHLVHGDTDMHSFLKWAKERV